MAQIKIRELFAQLGIKADTAKVKGYDAALGRTKRTMAGLVAGAAAVTGALFAVAHSTAQAADEATKAAQRLGITGQEFQEYSFAATEAGAGAKQVETAFRRMAVSFQDATEGAKIQAGAYKALGLNVRQLKKEGIGQAELFERLADGFKNETDEVKKMALANDVLGRAGAQLLPILNLGAKGIRDLREEARKTGAVFSDTALKDAEAFNDRLFEMQEVMRGVRNTIGVALIPVFTDMFVAFRSWFEVNREWVALRTEQVARSLAGAMSTLGKVLGFVDKIVQKTLGSWEPIIVGLSLALTAYAASRSWAMLATLYADLTVLATAFGNSAAAAWLTAAAPIAFFVAKVAALALVLEDLDVYLDDGDSAIGQLFDTMATRKGVVGTLTRALELMVEVLRDLNTVAQMISMTFAGLGDGSTFANLTKGADFAYRYTADSIDGTLGTEQGRVRADEARRVSRGLRDRVGPSLGSRARDIANQVHTGERRTIVIPGMRQGDINITGTGLSAEELQEQLREAQSDQTQMLLDEVEGREL